MLYLHTVFCVKEKEALTVVHQLFAVISSLVLSKIFHSETTTDFQGIVTFSALPSNFSQKVSTLVESLKFDFNNWLFVLQIYFWNVLLS